MPDRRRECRCLGQTESCVDEFQSLQLCLPWDKLTVASETFARCAIGAAARLRRFATSFSFALGVGEYMTIAFDALPFTQAFAGNGDGGYASANLLWSINLTTGARVFAFQPAQLNALSIVSRTGALGGASTYAPGWLSFRATTTTLNAGDVYQVSMAQSSLASALQNQPVAEPATLAAFGAGLLAMASLGRRRRH